MKQYIGLFRGINVGGKNILPMKELVNDLISIKMSEVQTLIQSGNIVFESENDNSSVVSQKISSMIKERYGFEPKVILLERDEFLKAILNNPFPVSESNLESLHLGFLFESPQHPNIEKLEMLRKESEQFQLIDKVFYLKAPEGIGKSKLAANLEKMLGVSMTDRNWRTVLKLKAMLGNMESQKIIDK